MPSPTPDIDATIQAGVEATVEAAPTGIPTLAATPIPSPTASPIPTSTVLPSSTPTLQPTAPVVTATPTPHLPVATFSGAQSYYQTSPFTVALTPWRLEWDVNYIGDRDYTWVVQMKNVEGGSATSLVDELYIQSSNGAVLVYEPPGTYYLQITGPDEGEGSWEVRIIEDSTALPTPTPRPNPTPTTVPTPRPDIPETVYSSQEYWYTISVPGDWIPFSDSTFYDVDRRWFYDWGLGTDAFVLVIVEEIDPTQYPTLKSYVDEQRDFYWNRYVMLSWDGIRTDQPIEAHLFSYPTTAGTQETSHWYLLGRHLVTVLASAKRQVWTDQAYSEVKQKMLASLDSFQPASHVSGEFGYAVVHPPDWEPIGEPDFDYVAQDPDLGVPQLRVQVTSSDGFTNVLEYMAAHPLQDKDILSSGRVFLDRIPRRSYRIDYTFTPETEDRIYRGAVLITLSGNNAIWVFVDDDLGNWNSIQGLVDDIFLRVAVVP